MTAKRLTRREIVQSDKVQITLRQLYGWGTQNAKWIVSVIVLAAIVLSGSYLWRNYRQSHETELQREFAEALQIYHSPLAGETDTESDNRKRKGKYQFASAPERHREALARFDALAQEYPSRRMGQLARYYVALNKRELGQPQEAKKILNSVIDHSDQTEVKNLARHSLAQIALLERNHEEAIRLLSEVLEAPWPDFPRQMVLLELAQTYEAQGNPEEALKQYRKIVTDYPSSEYDRQAQLRISQLEEK